VFSNSCTLRCSSEADERIITLDGVGVRQAGVLTNGSRLRRKRKTGEREQRERRVNDVRSCFHPFIFFLLVCFALHRGTVRNPIRGYAENLWLLESGLWFTSDTCRQEHADVIDEITAKGEVR